MIVFFFFSIPIGRFCRSGNVRLAHPCPLYAFFFTSARLFFVLDRETRETREKEREHTRNTTDRAEKARHGRDRKRACAKEETAGSILSDKRSVIYKANDFFRFSLKVVPCQPCQPR